MKTSRRNFIKTSGYVAIGFSVVPALACFLPDGKEPELPKGMTTNDLISSWLQVLESGRVKIFSGKMELGQGIRTAIAQVAAEELNMNIDLVEVQLAETNVTPDEGYTAGSNSVARSAMAVRTAAAAAVGIILDEAAAKYNLNRQELSLKNGKVFTGSGNSSYTFYEILNGQQIERGFSGEVLLKPKEEYTVVGTPVLREDIRKMVRGEEVYVQDLRFPGMVHARVLRPLAYDAQLTSFSKEKAEEVEGVLKVVREKNFVAVIAKGEYQAEKALEILKEECQWELRKKLPSGKDLKEYLPTLTSQHEKVFEKGNVEFGNEVIQASYFKPYIMHASLGPSCAVAYFDEDLLQIWTHCQGVYPLRDAVSKLVGLSEDKIRVTGIPGSGCYGHNGADDVAAEAAILAMKYPGSHLRLQWTRNEEHAWEPFGSAMIMEVQGELDSNGRINKWHYELWSDTHSTRPGGRKENLLPTYYYEGTDKVRLGGYLGGGYRNSEPYYSIPHQKVEANFFDGPLRVSALRSLGAYANVFAIESFMDELAEKAGKDPVEFRLMHLEDPRAVDVLKKVKEMTGGTTLEENEGLGFAFARYKNSAAYLAVAAKVLVSAENDIQIQNMWGAIDSGEVINPDGLKNQTEGGMIQAASWTMVEEVQFNEEHVSSVDWNSYPIFRFENIPQVEVEVINRPDEEALGAGEAAQGPAAAAIVNAIYKATGKRVRDLPVKKHLFRQIKIK